MLFFHREFILFQKINYTAANTISAWGNGRDILGRHHFFARDMTAEERAQKFHTDDALLPTSG